MKYYMHIGGQQVGPYEENELPSHGLTASTMVWREGMPDWVTASQVPELSHLLPATSLSQVTGRSSLMAFSLPCPTPTWCGPCW